MPKREMRLFRMVQVWKGQDEMSNQSARYIAKKSRGHKTFVGTEQSGCGLFFLKIMQLSLSYCSHCPVTER